MTQVLHTVRPSTKTSRMRTQLAPGVARKQIPTELPRNGWKAARMGADLEISITWGVALGWRMERHLLDPVGSGSVSDVVGQLGAVLAMDESLAELAVRTRRTTSRPGELSKALADGSLIKVFAFRGSMHYLTPEEGGVYLAVRAAGRQWELPSWVEYYQLGPADWPDFRAAVRDALQDGPLTIHELGDLVTRPRAYRHLKPVFDDGAGTLVKPLTWQGDMSFGLPRDGQPTCQRLDHNPRWKGIPDLDDAGPRAITMYLRTYGPATFDHIHYWLGSGLSAGRKRLDRWLSELGDRLVAVDVEGTPAYALAEDVESLAAARPSNAVRFLPGHDQWVMGPGAKDIHVTPSTHREAVTRKANPVIAGGVVCGTWAAKGDELTVAWLEGTPPPRKAIEKEARRLAAILGTDLHLTLNH
ncbi:MAG TPA: winged helix DNA-binding domain-containing protein [Nocardioides sp.]|uniref:winged helix DNA-binding domain-containing protein n=1 Tax=Nocardioides sp. TaxID=35761 RepID=UPI002E359C82|nr:winged helix DNA-binding domain-containing protein [Nocardioides sp.]HEX5090021.1 winged helix DNA-binding domain-containing protein [Nocardioides sp.]